MSGLVLRKAVLQVPLRLSRFVLTHSEVCNDLITIRKESVS